MLADANSYYSSSKPDEVEPSVAIIPANHPLLVMNNVAF